LFTGPLLDASPDALLVTDSEGVIQVANHLAAELFGYTVDELVGNQVEVLVPADARDHHHVDRSAYSEQPTQRSMGAGRRLTAERRDGSRFPVQISLSPIEVNGGQYVVAAIRDVSVWLETERELASARRRRTMAEEHERIARDLHDTVIQELFAIGMSLQAVHAEAQPGRVSERIAHAVDALDDTIRQIRTTIFELNSGTRLNPLTKELRQLVDALSMSLGFEPAVTLIGPIDTQLPISTAAHVLPTVREGLSNVARHARASRAELLVSLQGDELRVEVHDNGVGMPTDLERSSGLRNLERRARELGGSLRVHAGPQGGTVLEWVVPAAVDDLD
jgi:PAS domain S-box-containing protein